MTPCTLRAQAVHMAITVSSPQDLKYIVSLSKVHAEELGFLTRSAMEHYLLTHRVRMARENGEPCGYFLTSSVKHTTRIFQACVQIDARGLHHAQSLLGDLLSRAAAGGAVKLSLHCRDGLESNGFWSSCGFRLATVAPGGAARRKIVNTWELGVAEAFSNPSLPYAAEFFRRIRAGAAACTFPGASEKKP